MRINFYLIVMLLSSVLTVNVVAKTEGHPKRAGKNDIIYESSYRNGAWDYIYGGMAIYGDGRVYDFSYGSLDTKVHGDLNPFSDAVAVIHATKKPRDIKLSTKDLTLLMQVRCSPKI